MGPPVEGEEGPPAGGNESLHLTGLSEDVGTEPSRGIHRQQTPSYHEKGDGTGWQLLWCCW